MVNVYPPLFHFLVIPYSINHLLHITHTHTRVVPDAFSGSKDDNYRTRIHIYDGFGWLNRMREVTTVINMYEAKNVKSEQTFET